MRYLFLSVCAASIAMASVVARSQDAAATPDLYTAKVQPILQQNCYKCHGNGNHKGGLVMDTRDSFLKGGHDGPDIMPGDPDKSLLVSLIKQQVPSSYDDLEAMPPDPKPKLNDDDISTIVQWIKAGAPMPAAAPKP